VRLDELDVRRWMRETARIAQALDESCCVGGVGFGGHGGNGVERAILDADRRSAA
jgi:hypothetical protein